MKKILLSSLFMSLSLASSAFAWGPFNTDGMQLSFSYVPAQQGAALLTGGPTDVGYAATFATSQALPNASTVAPALIWQPRYQPQSITYNTQGASDTYSGTYQFNIDPEYAWTGSYTPFAIDANGNLRIRAQTAASTSPSIASQLPNNSFTSAAYTYVGGVLSSKTAFSQQGGYWEICAQIPTGYAVWPALWLMPVVETHPPEIDILEFVGNFDGTNIYRTNSFSSTAVANSIQANAGQVLSTGFHRYGVAWNDTTLTHYLDGVPVSTRNIAGLPEFQQPFYLLMSTQIGSNLSLWVPPPNGTTPSPADMLIKYVKVWTYPGPVGPYLSASSYLDSLAVNGTVGTLSAGNNGGNASFTYTKLSDPDNMFTISGSNLNLSQVVASTVKSSHQVTIMVTDGQGRSKTRLFNIGVVNAAPVQANYFTSQALNNAFWGAAQATVTGTNTFVETAVNNTHAVYPASVMARTAGVVSYGAWAEGKITATRSEMMVIVQDSTYANGAQVYCNLATGVVDYVSTIGTFTNASATITPISGGGYRCAMQFTTDLSSTGLQAAIRTATGSGPFVQTSFLGVVTAGLTVNNPWLYNLGATAGNR